MTFASIAQDYQDVVYLTDGSMIKGYIFEQIPNDYLKIETRSGKIYIIEMDEVERIIKERPRSRIQSNNRRQNTNLYNYPNTRNSQQNSQNNYNDYYDVNSYSYFPNKGYKGFIDLGFSFGTSSNVGNYSYDGENRFEFSTSHGFFFNPYIFVGLGVGFHFYTGYNEGGRYYSYDDVTVEIPIFAHVRTHFIDKKVSPFADVKLGYSVNDDGGTYFCPSIGCRFAKGSRSAFWISLGYTVQYIDDLYYNTSASSEAVTFKLGWDF